MRASLARHPITDALPVLSAPVAVCVPVRDERRRLPVLLRALSGQRGVAPFHVCLLFDGPQPHCESRARALSRGASFTLVCQSIDRGVPANAGRARRAALELGLAAVGAKPRALLLSTDADSVPASDWIAANVRALTDVDVVAGHVRRAAAHRQPERQRLERYLERLYRLERTIDAIDYDPAPSHPGIGGASLGFRATVYRALGGFGAYSHDEDVQIVNAARHAGYRLRHDRAVRVTTSSRLTGRAEGGLADELRRNRDCSGLPVVEHPADAFARYRQAAAARSTYHNASADALDALAARLNADLVVIHGKMARAASAEAFTLAVVPETHAERTVDLAAAERVLTRLEAEYSSNSGRPINGRR